jgi:ribosomal protein S18 acetylase RimI-like enzyme
MTDIQLRKLVEEDLRHIKKVREDCRLFPMRYTDEDLETRFKRLIREQRGWAALHKGKFVGCICLDRDNWVHLAVLSEHRRKGFARQMLEKMPVHGTTVYALIPNANAIAIRLFTTAGYRPYEYTKDHLIMQKAYGPLRAKEAAQK